MVGYQKIARLFGMEDTKCLRKWVKQYQEKGEEFFKNKQKRIYV
ncbi:MAG: helix-turn-helix domain-containing protein [Clostridia bacterium]|nr:helix-turn-helix domain-containing protein [Clostridia bacterium]